MTKPEKFTKKPVVVWAIQWTGDNLREIIDFTGLHESARSWTWEHYVEVVKADGLKIFTKEGPLKAAIGDYIVKGYSVELGDHFWPVKPDYFVNAYNKSESYFSEFDKLRDDAFGK